MAIAFGGYLYRLEADIPPMRHAIKSETSFYRGAMFAILSAMSSGIMLPLGKRNATSDGFLSFLFEVTLIASVVSSPWLLRRAGVVSFWKHPKRLRGFFLHSFASVLALSLLWSGTSQVSAAVAGFLSNTHVLFAVALSILFLKDRPGRRTIAGGGLIVLGIILMRGGEGNDWGAFFDFDWAWFLIIASAATFAVADLLIKQTAAGSDMYAYLAVRNIVMMASFGVLCLVFGSHIEWANLLRPSLMTTAVLGIIGSRLFFNLSLEHISLSHSALIFQVQPLFVALFSWIFYRELPQNYEWLGGLVIMSGVMVVMRRH
jgi:drug/metabolite transporter (DMT)-like permease